jgi:hemerythrin-like domain-containing protein
MTETYSEPLVDLLYSSHRRLERRVLELQELYRGAKDPTDADLRDQLVSFRMELAEHIRQEDDNGCLEEAVCRCPSLGPRVAQLQGEHLELLKSLDALLGGLGRGAEFAAADVASALGELAVTLRRHEAMENEVLASAFGLSWTADNSA